MYTIEVIDHGQEMIALGTREMKEVHILIFHPE
jgi:hypothetical protein